MAGEQAEAFRRGFGFEGGETRAGGGLLAGLHFYLAERQAGVELVAHVAGLLGCGQRRIEILYRFGGLAGSGKHPRGSDGDREGEAVIAGLASQ